MMKYPTQEILETIEEMRQLSFSFDQSASNLQALQQRVDELLNSVNQLHSLQTVYEKKSHDVDESLKKLKSAMDFS